MLLAKRAAGEAATRKMDAIRVTTGDEDADFWTHNTASNSPIARAVSRVTGDDKVWIFQHHDERLWIEVFGLSTPLPAEAAAFSEAWDNGKQPEPISFVLPPLSDPAWIPDDEM